MRNSSGKFINFFTLDANSASFDDDLTFVYRENVLGARRENKRLFGSPDGSKHMTKLLKSESLGAARKR